MPIKSICWLRQDLRLSDNPALSAAADAGTVLLVYILDTTHSEKKPLGAASRTWLHHSLAALQNACNKKLILQQGDPLAVLSSLIKKHAITSVYWNRCYEPWQIHRDKKIKSALKRNGLSVHTFNASLLWEPWEIEKKAGGNYQVFTPFYQKGCLPHTPPRRPLPAPKSLTLIPDASSSTSLSNLTLLPTHNWHKACISHWEVGEAGANNRLQSFIKKTLQHYKSSRDFPALNATTRLSPALHWGEISPHQIWYALKTLQRNDSITACLRQLAWREFSYSLLYYHPALDQQNLQKKFNGFPWRSNQKRLRAWQQGNTGYPIIDAGMRELYQTGYMHNRIRMVTASFLVKNLLIHWHEGEKWFWNCLFDADLANNSAGWQWVAGCGADAAPFFRIFNPTTQAKKFDPDGDYIRHYVPELAKLPTQHLFSPWKAPDNILASAGIEIGKNYPAPIVDLSNSRKRALAAYQKIKVST